MKLFLILSYLTIVFAEIYQEFSGNVRNIEDIEPNTTEEIRRFDSAGEEIYTQPKNKEDSFDWRLTKEVFKQNDKENIVVSPISVKLLLIALAEAASQDVNSRTREELKMVLPGNKTLEHSRKYFLRILNGLNKRNEDYTLNIGSRGFLRNDITASQKLKSNLEHFYNFHFENVSFTNPANLVKEINNWVRKMTNGKINSLVDRESVSNSVILLINAIYFRGIWETPFEKTVTKEFQVEKNLVLKKEFVQQMSDYYYLFSKNLSAKILRLPYEGDRFSMFILLPFEADGLDNLVKNLDAKKLEQEVDKMELNEVLVTLPKFKFDSSFKLKTVLKALGISEIFEDSATFPLFQSRNAGLKVSNLIQKSGIVVDEKGSEGYAATEAELIDKFGGTPREFNAKHPFVFYIEDDITGAKLFSGVVNNPEY